MTESRKVAARDGYSYGVAGIFDPSHKVYAPNGRGVGEAIKGAGSYRAVAYGYGAIAFGPTLGGMIEAVVADHHVRTPSVIIAGGSFEAERRCSNCRGEMPRGSHSLEDCAAELGPDSKAARAVERIAAGRARGRTLDARQVAHGASHAVSPETMGSKAETAAAALRERLRFGRRPSAWERPAGNITAP